MVAAELLSFFLPTLLRDLSFSSWRRSLALLGICITTFQIATITITQRTLILSADVASSANQDKVAELKSQIYTLRDSAKQLRAVAAQYANSTNAQQRNRAQGAIKDALPIEAQISELSIRLNDAQVQTKPTLSSLFSPTYQIIFLGARSALISFIGILMFSLSGALFRTFILNRSQEEETLESKPSKTVEWLQTIEKPTEQPTQEVEVISAIEIKQEVEPELEPEYMEELFADAEAEPQMDQLEPVPQPEAVLSHEEIIRGGYIPPRSFGGTPTSGMLTLPPNHKFYGTIVSPTEKSDTVDIFEDERLHQKVIAQI